MILFFFCLYLVASFGIARTLTEGHSDPRPPLEPKSAALLALFFPIVLVVFGFIEIAKALREKKGPKP